MSTQHPDNVNPPFFAENPELGGEDEIQEAFHAFSNLGCSEQMWDCEGKEVDNIPLLVPIFEDGRRVYSPPNLDEIKHRASEELSRLWPEVTRLENPAEYLVGLSPKLKEIRDRMIKEHAIRH